MPPSPRIFLVRPPCSWCGGDRDAAVETHTLFGATALLCEICAEQIGRGPRHPIEELPAARPLPKPGEVRDYLESQSWTYAKTMPRWPHEYVLLNRSTDPWAHLRAVAFIREHGDKRPFNRRVHSYWRAGDGWEYWTMRGSDTILNRRRVEEP